MNIINLHTKLKKELEQWIVHWTSDPEKVETYLNRLKWTRPTDSKEDFFALLIMTVGAARAYGITDEEVKLAIRQLLRRI